MTIWRPPLSGIPAFMSVCGETCFVKKVVNDDGDDYDDRQDPKAFFFISPCNGLKSPFLWIETE